MAEKPKFVVYPDQWFLRIGVVEDKNVPWGFRMKNEIANFGSNSNYIKAELTNHHTHNDDPSAQGSEATSEELAGTSSAKTPATSTAGDTVSFSGGTTKAPSPSPKPMYGMEVRFRTRR